MPQKTILDEYMDDPEFVQTFAQEEFILEITERICEIMQQDNVSRTELACRLGCTKGNITQLLGGGRNLTVRRIADIFRVLGYRPRITWEKVN